MPIEDAVRIFTKKGKARRIATDEMILANSPGSGQKKGEHPMTWNYTIIRRKHRKREPIYVVFDPY